MADSGRMRLDSLTGLRAVAAGLVFCNHFGDLFQDHFSWFVNRSLASGRCDVSFFFILSGLVLACEITDPAGHRVRMMPHDGREDLDDRGSTRNQAKEAGD